MPKAAFTWESRIIDPKTNQARHNGAGIVLIDLDDHGRFVQHPRLHGTESHITYSAVDDWVASITIVENWRFDIMQDVRTVYTIRRDIDRAAIDDRRVYLAEAVGHESAEVRDDRGPFVSVIVRRPRYVVVSSDYIAREPTLVQLTRDVDGWPQAFTLNGIVYTRVVF